MKNTPCSTNIRDLTLVEHILFRDTFDQYRNFLLSFLSSRDIFISEEDLIKRHENDDIVLEQRADDKHGIAAIVAAMPYRFVHAGGRRKITGEQLPASMYVDLCCDYEITPEDVAYPVFFAYSLRQTDLLDVDEALNYFMDFHNSYEKTDFVRFVTLTLRKHATLFQPEQADTIHEWIARTEKEAALSGTVEARTKGRPKRQRDDKVTLLNQEQTALLIYCLRETKVIFSDEFLNNKEAGQAFSILTGYSADTIRQNLNKSELSNLATFKNIEVVEKALQAVVKYVSDNIKPE